MNWKPYRKILAEIWLAVAGNGAVAGVIAGTDSDWRTLGLTIGASVLTIVAGYLTPESKLPPGGEEVTLEN